MNMKTKQLSIKKHAGLLFVLIPIIVTLIVTTAVYGILWLFSVTECVRETLSLNIGSACGVVSYIIFALWIVNCETRS